MRGTDKTIKTVASPESPPCLPTTATVSEAIELMSTKGCHGVLVTDDERLVGIFTERDLLYRVAAPGLTSKSLALGEVMSADPVALSEDATISYAINHMGFHGFSHVPILDHSGRPVALLDIRDVTNHLSGVFDDLASRPRLDAVASPWVDIGGG
jgi:CBS domain-containing protein